MIAILEAFFPAFAINADEDDLIPGIAPWGALIGREALLRKTKKKSTEDDASEGQNDIHIYSKNQPNSRKCAGIDANHQFFVLVDNGTACEFGTEIKGRALMEEILCDPSPEYQPPASLGEAKKDTHQSAGSREKTGVEPVRMLEVCPRSVPFHFFAILTFDLTWQSPL